MSEAEKAALEVLALVDEFPSEPFSYERKQIEEKLILFLCRFADIAEDARQSCYEVGFDDGFEEGRQEAIDEYETRIQELEDKIAEHEEDLQQKIDDATAEGYEAAKIEYGIN